MKIRGLQVKDFMCYDEATVQLGVLNVVVGRNNAGKSALFRDAVQFVLLGKAKGLKRKKDSVALQKSGASGMSASLFVTATGDQETIELKRTATGQLPITIPDLEALMGVPVPAAECMLDCMAFLNMSLEERLAVLASIGGHDPSAQLAQFFAPILPEDGTKKMVEMAVADRRKALDFAVERRRENKRKLAEQEALPAPADETAQAAGREVKLSEVRVEKLTESLVKAKMNVRDLGFAVGAAKMCADPAALRERLVANAEQQKEQASAIEKEIGRLKMSLNTLGLAEQGLSDAQEKFAKHADAVRKASLDLAGWETVEKQRQAELTAASGLSGECPTCHQTVPDLHRAKLIDDLEKQMTATHVEMKRLEKVIGKEKDECKKFNDSIGQAQAALAERGDLTAAIGKLTDCLTSYRMGHADLTTELGRLVEEAKAIQTDIKAVEAAAAKEGEFTAAEKQVAELQALFDKASVYSSARVLFDRAQALVPRLKNDIEKWDKVAQILADDGPAAELAGSGWSKERLVQSAGLLLPGRAVDIEADGSIVLDGRPIEVASESERYRVGVAIADLIAFCGKGRFLVLDGADIVQDEAKAAVSAFVRTISPEYETIILIATGDPAKLWHVQEMGEKQVDVVLLADGKPFVVR